MARTVTLLQLRTDISYQADIVTGTTGRYTTDMLNRFINQSIQRFRERVSQEGIQHYLVSATGSISAGATSPYPFATLDMSAFSPNVVRTFGVDITYQNVVRTLQHRPLAERSAWGGPQIVGMPEAWSHIQTDLLAILPAPDQAYPYTIWYLPLAADLSSDVDTFDGVAGWEEFIVWDVVTRVITRDQYAAAYQLAVTERDRVWADVLRAATRVTAAGGAVVGRDSFGEYGLRDRTSRRTVIAGGSTLPPNGSITNAILADMVEGKIKGRAMGAGNGDPQDLSPQQAAGILPVYSGTIAGLVPSGPGSSSLFLRSDGTWQTAGGGGPTMLAAGPVGAVQFNGGSGFAGSGAFLYTGGALKLTGDLLLGSTPGGTGTIRLTYGGSIGGNAVGNDSQLIAWRQALGQDYVLAIGASGVPDVQFLPSDQVTFRIANTQRARINSDQLAFSNGMRLGLPALAQNTPSGLSLDKLGAWTPSGFANVATGISVVGSGAGLSARGITVASLSAPAFAGGAAGLVPSGAAIGQFLRDDGTWAAPPGGSTPTGVTNAQLYLEQPTTFKARYTLGTGAPEDITPAQAVSMLPNFTSTTRGVVPYPSGGAGGLFLKDDATWASPGNSAATGITNAQHALSPPFTVKGLNTAATGTVQDLDPGQVASMLWMFSGAGRAGLVAGPTGGVAGKWLRDDGSWQGIPTGGNLPSGGLLSTIAAPRVIGRFTTGTGAAEVLMGSAVASMIPNFAPSLAGLVPYPTAGAIGQFLRDDGTWRSVGSGPAVPSGSYLSEIASPRVLGRFTTGTGAAEVMLGSAVASMLPVFAPSLHGLVHYPTGGASQQNFLRADGVFTAPTGLVIPGQPSGSMQYNGGTGLVGATGIRPDNDIGLVARAITVASLSAPIFGTRIGLVPTSSSSGSLFLRDDGTWVAAGGGGGGPTMLAGGPAGAVQYNGGSGLAGASGFTYNTGSGVVLWGSVNVASGYVAIGGVGSGGWPDISSGHLRLQAGAIPLMQIGYSGVEETILRYGAVSDHEFTIGGGVNQRRTQMRLAAGGDYGWDVVTGTRVAGLDTSHFGLKAGRRLGLMQLAHTSPSGTSLDRLGAWTASGFANVATGINLTGSGVGLDARALTVASLSAPLFGTQVGLVPTAASAGLFLRDDATWQTPAAGSATGLSNAMHLPMPPLTFKARQTLGSGIPEDISVLQAATMLPLFYATGSVPGTVRLPTGGASGLFLKDDGTWQEMFRNEIKNGNLGSGTTSGSFTIDFRNGPFHYYDSYGSMKLYLAPGFATGAASPHRHFQLRWQNQSSGYCPTFFGTAVKFGPSNTVPSLFSRASGAVNIANFFYDGTVMWGSAGQGGFF